MICTCDLICDLPITEEQLYVKYVASHYVTITLLLLDFCMIVAKVSLAFFFVLNTLMSYELRSKVETASGGSRNFAKKG